MRGAPFKTRSSGACFLPSTLAIRRSLREARRKQSLSQQEVAERSGLTVRSVEALETEESISLRDLRAVCGLLALSAPKHPRSALEPVGKLLRDRRELAHLSRKELARRIGVSDATIKFLETARKIPSRKTLLSLVAVPELGLTWSDFGGFGGPDPGLPRGTPLVTEPLPGLVVSAATAPSRRRTPAQDPTTKPEEEPTGTVRMEMDLRIVVVGPLRLSDVLSQLGQALVRGAGPAFGK